jgi:hypothetical protein
MSPPIDMLVLLTGAVIAALLATLTGLIIRNVRRRRRDQKVPIAAVEQKPAPPTAPVLDEGALVAAVAEAEAEGSSRRLPGLYLSLAQLRTDAGDDRGAGELLRKCIRAAVSADLKEPHAKARLALGDLAQAAGDPVTACEHWQIARKLFHELGRRGDYNAVDARMLRNGCPTDWVLTDF